MEIRKAVPEDAVRLLEITVAAKAHWGYGPDWMAAWADLLQLPPAYFAHNDVYKAVTDCGILGWYALVRRNEHVLLDHLWVLPMCMRQGIGRQLWLHALAHAKAQDISRLELEAEPHAVGFYERMGARIIGETESDMGRRIPLMAFDLHAP